jgi:hypothetical protein
MRYAEIKRRLGGFDTAEAHQRLRLAEFKFARTMDDYFKRQHLGKTALTECFFELFWSATDELPLKILHECGRVLEYHRQNAFSHPDETRDNMGIITWGYSDGLNDSFSWNQDISYLHWTARNGQHKYVIGQVSADPKLAVRIWHSRYGW